MKRYAIYCRVSSDEQSGPDKVSLADQLRQCRQHVLAQGGSVTLELQDVQTGLDPGRAGYQRLIEAARGGEIDAAVVWKWDRWGRDAGESISRFGELQRLGIAVESLIEPTSDPFLQGLYALLGQKESQNISVRTKAGLMAHARRGDWSGAPPLGYRVVRTGNRSTLEPDIAKAGLVRRLFDAAATGAYSLAVLADMAKEWGLRSKQNYMVSRQAIGKMLRNPSYRGAVAYGRKTQSKFAPWSARPEDEWIVTEDAHPPLVDRATWDTVQMWLSQHQRVQGTVRNTTHLLTSLVYCGRCAGIPGPDGKARLWRVYCHGSKGAQYQCSRTTMYGACSLPGVYAPPFEAAVKLRVQETFGIPSELRHLAADVVQQEAEAARTVVDRQRTDLERAIERHRRDRLQLARRLMSDVIAADVYQQLEAEELSVIARLEREIATLPPAPPTVDVTAILATIATLEWSDLDDDDWRAVLTLLIDRILLDGRDSFRIEWAPAADVLRLAVAKVSH